MPEDSRHMTPEEFRRHGREIVDWIADYWERIESLPVMSRVEPGEIADRLPDEPPRESEPFADIMRDLDDVILPGVTHWQSPGWFGYFPANSSGPSVLGELLASGLGVQGMLWSTSPACTELETRVLDWLVGMLDLPPVFRSDGPGGGVIQDSASSAVLCALLAAREQAGTNGVIAYGSTETHSSLAKAVRVAGLGDDGLRSITVDETRAMNPTALDAQIRADLVKGLRPTFVSATIGTTSSHAIDPVRAIGKICREHGLWLHIDAAHAGAATICPEFRHLNDGLELADSYCFNPHKWLFTNFDCDCFWVADRDPLLRAMSILPEYLRNAPTESGAVTDYRDWHIPLGRRFRALKLWMVIRHYGVEGLRHHLREHVKLAREFVEWVRRDEDWELAAPAPLNLVCFRHNGGDEINRRILDSVNADGRIFLTHTKLDGRLTLRMSIGQTHTERRHVETAWALLCQAGYQASRR